MSAAERAVARCAGRKPTRCRLAAAGTTTAANDRHESGDGRTPDVPTPHHDRRRAVRQRLPWRTRNAFTHTTNDKEIDMKKTLCAMKAALGVRGIGGCLGWRWVYYHNI